MFPRNWLPAIAAFTLGIISGCGGGSPSVPSSSSTPSGNSSSNADSGSANQRDEIVASWSQFVNAARSRIGDARNHFRERWNSGEIEISILGDDVNQTTSLKYAAEGKITIDSTQRFGGITRKDFTHTLRFGYSGGRWEFIGGSVTGPDKSGTMDGMPSWQRVMFP